MVYQTECLNRPHIKAIEKEIGLKLSGFYFNMKYFLEISENTNFSLSFFGLDAKRNALGFRTNRVDQIDFWRRKRFDKRRV